MIIQLTMNQDVLLVGNSNVSNKNYWLSKNRELSSSSKKISTFIYLLLFSFVTDLQNHRIQRYCIRSDTKKITNKKFIFSYLSLSLFLSFITLSASCFSSYSVYVISTMASSNAKKSCTKCPKGQGQVLCDGCQRWYCVMHLLEHRQELSQQMDNLTLEHDQFQETLLVHDNGRPNPLITRVDRWETKSIEKIKQVAREVRQDLNELIDQSKKDLAASLRRITDELQENRQMETYTENDLERWTFQLRELREKLLEPIMIEIKYDEEKESSTHLPLIQLRLIKPTRGKRKHCSHQKRSMLCISIL